MILVHVSSNKFLITNSYYGHVAQAITCQHSVAMTVKQVIVPIFIIFFVHLYKSED